MIVREAQSLLKGQLERDRPEVQALKHKHFSLCTTLGSSSRHRRWAPDSYTARRVGYRILGFPRHGSSGKESSTLPTPAAARFRCRLVLQGIVPGGASPCRSPFAPPAAREG